MQTTIHDKAEIWAAAAATGGLNETELKAWSDHIAVCPACKKLNDEELVMGMLIKKLLQPESPDPGFERRMIFKFRQAHAKNRSLWHQFFQRPLVLAGTAGCFALIAFVVTGWLMKENEEKPSQVVSVTPAIDLNLPPPVQNPMPKVVQPQLVESNIETVMASLPAPVRMAITGVVGQGKLEGVDKTFDDGEIAYEATVSTPDGREHNLTFAPDGTLTSEEMAMADLPAPVQHGITTVVGQGKLEGVDKTFDDGEIAYEATVSTPDGREHNLTFAPDGTLTSEEMAMADLPAPVQHGITTVVGSGKLEGIDKTFDDGEIAYEATVSTPDGQEHNLTFAPDGTLTSEEMAMADLPAPVQHGITTVVGSGKLEGIDKTFDDGEIDYEVTMSTPDGREHNLTFAPDGTLTSEEMAMADLPVPVQHGITTVVGSGKLEGIDKTFDDGEIAYEATMSTSDGQEHNLTFAPDGTLTSEEMAMADLPAPVQGGITAAVGQGKLEEVDKTLDDGEIDYEVTMSTPDGREHNLTFAPDGTLTSEEMAMADLPAPVQGGITAAVGQGKLEGVDKTFDDGEIAYEATVSTSDGKEHNLTFAPDGTLTCVEMDMADLPAPVQGAITAVVGSGKLEGIDKTFDDGKIAYEATVSTPDGQEHGFTFSTGGKLLSREVALNETPFSVRKTISKALGGGKLVEIDQSFVAIERVMPYEVEAQKNGKPFDFMVSPNGQFMGMEN